MAPSAAALPVLDAPLEDLLAGCCSPVTCGVLAVDAAERLARVFKALGDPTRVRLLSLIAAHADAEACVCDLTTPSACPSPRCRTTSSSWSRQG